MKQFLIAEFGKDQAEKISQHQQERLDTLVKQCENKSKNQLKTLKTLIYPPIALYQALIEIPMENDKALQITEKILFHEYQKTANLYQKLEKLPSFFKLFKMGFKKKMNGDNWEFSIEQNDAKAIIFTIKRCLWLDTCREQNCPELCPLFCKSDNVIYGKLKKVTFQRTQTLGMGGECCDFKYINNKIK
jgi:hypothetical protein